MPSDIRLRYLYQAARQGTMRAASDKLDVAPSSVSRQITELENELGLPLIERGRRRIKLTEAGEAACLYYREKRSQEEAFLSKIEEMKSLRVGKITLAVGEAFVTQRFSDMLQAFMQRYAGMQVNVIVANTNAVVDLVREDEAHTGMIFDIPRDPKIRAKLIMPSPLKVIVPRKHAFAKEQYVNLSDLENESIGLPEDGYRIRQLIHAAEQEEGVFLEAAMTTNSLALIIDFIKSGRGVSILPELVVQEELSTGEAHAVPTRNKTLNATKTSLIARLGRQLPIGAHRLSVDIERHLNTLVKK